MNFEAMCEARDNGDITSAELMEWVSLKAKESRLAELSRSIESGQTDLSKLYALTQQDVGDILGVTQQTVAETEARGLKKLAKNGYDLKSIGII